MLKQNLHIYLEDFEVHPAVYFKCFIREETIHSIFTLSSYFWSRYNTFHCSFGYDDTVYKMNFFSKLTFMILYKISINMDLSQDG